MPSIETRPSVKRYEWIYQSKVDRILKELRTTFLHLQHDFYNDHHDTRTFEIHLTLAVDHADLKIREARSSLERGLKNLASAS